MPTTLIFSKSAASVDHLGHTPRHRPDEFPVPANEIEASQKIVRRGNVNKSILRRPISTKFSQVVTDYLRNKLCQFRVYPTTEKGFINISATDKYL